MKGKKEPNLLQYIFEEFIDTKLSEEILLDSTYRKTNSARTRLSNQYLALDLKKQQRKVIDKYIDSINESGSIYGEYAYKAGFKDCSMLLKELGLLN